MNMIASKWQSQDLMSIYVTLKLTLVTMMPSASHFSEWYVPIASRVPVLKGNKNVSLQRRSSAVRGWGNTFYTIVAPYLHLNFEFVNGCL